MAKEEKKEEGKKGFISRFGKAAREMIYGMAAHDTARFALKTRGVHGTSVYPDHHGRPAGGADFASVLFAANFALCGSADFHLEAPDAAGTRPDGRSGLKERRKNPCSCGCLRNEILKIARRSAPGTLPNKEVSHSTRRHFQKVSRPTVYHVRRKRRAGKDHFLGRYGLLPGQTRASRFWSSPSIRRLR